jgi:Family of unknown function (DUF5681)
MQASPKAGRWTLTQANLKRGTSVSLGPSCKQNENGSKEAVLSTENSDKNRGNLTNLVPNQFKPGESGNPGGRPKKLPITDLIMDQLHKPLPKEIIAKLSPTFSEIYGENATFGEMLAFKLIIQASQGDMRAMNILMERVEGKVTQNLAHSGSTEEPIVFRVIRVNV